MQSSASTHDGRRPCPRCGYDLRGLPGPLLNCPECGVQTRAADIPAASQRRLRELQGAGDGLVHASVALLAAAGLALLGSGMHLVLGVVVLGGLLGLAAARTCRRLLAHESEWPAAFTNYVQLTVLLAGLPFAAWAVATVAAWRLRTSDATSPIEIVDAAISLPPALALLLFSGAIRRLRWAQRRAFVQLARLVRGKTRRADRESNPPDHA
jgi:hypothetical protein